MAPVALDRSHFGGFCVVQHLVIGVEFSDHIVIAGDMTDIDILVTSLRTKALFAMGMTRKVPGCCTRVELLARAHVSVVESRLSWSSMATWTSSPS